ARHEILHLLGERAIDRHREKEVDPGGGHRGRRRHRGERAGERHRSQEPHCKLSYLMPVNRKELTNWRWKSANAMRRGPATKRVAAATRPQSAACSAERTKEVRPTVSTILSGLSVTINGQRNSFQWEVSETIENAMRPG